jgi:hypothetical protein
MSIQRRRGMALIIIIIIAQALDGSRGDGLILGASSMGHLTENVEACLGRERLPQVRGLSSPGLSSPGLTWSVLPQPVLDALDAAWDNCKPDCPPYQRGYSNSAAAEAKAAKL